MKKNDIKKYKGFFEINGLDVMFLNGTSFEDCRQFKPDLTISEYNKAIGKKEVKEKKEKYLDKSLKSEIKNK